jgi:hypothetical protein
MVRVGFERSALYRKCLVTMLALTLPRKLVAPGAINPDDAEVFGFVVAVIQ